MKGQGGLSWWKNCTRNEQDGRLKSRDFLYDGRKQLPEGCGVRVRRYRHVDYVGGTGVVHAAIRRACICSVRIGVERRVMDVEADKRVTRDALGCTRRAAPAKQDIVGVGVGPPRLVSAGAGERMRQQAAAGGNGDKRRRSHTHTGRVMLLVRLPSMGRVWFLGRKLATMSAVPSPACTSKSTMAMRLRSG